MTVTNDWLWDFWNSINHRAWPSRIFETTQQHIQIECSFNNLCFHCSCIIPLKVLRGHARCSNANRTPFMFDRLVSFSKNRGPTGAKNVEISYDISYNVLAVIQSIFGLLLIRQWLIESEIDFWSYKNQSVNDLFFYQQLCAANVQQNTFLNVKKSTSKKRPRAV